MGYLFSFQFFNSFLQHLFGLSEQPFIHSHYTRTSLVWLFINHQFHKFPDSCCSRRPRFGLAPHRTHLAQERVIARLVREALWRGEGGRAGRVGEEGVGAVELVGDAQVGDLDEAVAVPEEVAGLDVPVDDLLVVQVLQAEHDVAEGQPRGPLLQGVLGRNLVHDLCEIDYRYMVKGST